MGSPGLSIGGGTLHRKFGVGTALDDLLAVDEAMGAAVEKVVV